MLLEEEEKSDHGVPRQAKNVILSEPSVIKEVNESLDLLYEWSGNRRIWLKLVYRGSRDGTSIPNFH